MNWLLMTDEQSAARVSASEVDVIAQDPKTLRLKTLARKLANNDLTVLISGESGTGKEIFARFIHNQSPRREQPFVAVNCAAIPENMLEAILFGHEKGAFTGAHSSRRGKFEQAHGGTLLLDEMSEMEMGLQAKLLRVLQEREVERLGSERSIKLDVRVLATTNRDLKQDVVDGRFREDLYYRLNVLPLLLPPLRDRPGDIPPLALAMLERVDSGQSTRQRGFTQAALDRLVAHSWPGNVRELENLIQRSAVMCIDSVLDASDLLFEVSATKTQDESEELLTLEAQVWRCEKRAIARALALSGGNRQEAAARLDVSPRTLRHKLARVREETATEDASVTAQPPSRTDALVDANVEADASQGP